MFCTKCGSEMPDGTDFCTNCGARMGTASPAAAPAEPASMPAAGMPPVQGAVQKKSHQRAVIVGMCVVGVLERQHQRARHAVEQHLTGTERLHD